MRLQLTHRVMHLAALAAVVSVLLAAAALGPAMPTYDYDVPAQLAHADGDDVIGAGAEQDVRPEIDAGNARGHRLELPPTSRIAMA